MALVFTLARRGVPERRGRQKVVTQVLDCTSYLNPGGISVSVAQLQMNRLEDLQIASKENAYLFVWDGSLSAPVIKAYKQDDTTNGALVEVADTVDVGEMIVTAYGR